MDSVVQLNSALTGRYEIDRELGRGGMAVVYLARDLRHQRKVALKVLNPELGAVLGVERFLAEIQVTANLQHPNLLPLFDSGAAEGLLFYVMPFVDGESLRGKLDREKQLPIDEALRLATAIASALDYAHRHGVIHRDLKPENILLHEGQPLVADFGIALAVSNAGGSRITQTGLSLGTPQYMSPEQATGDRVIDGRTDIYSLGALLYEMLSGEPPHIGNTSQAVIARVLTEKPRSVRLTRPSVPPHVGAAVERALEKLPADRWATARDFGNALTGESHFAPRGSDPIESTIGRAATRFGVERFAPVAWAVAALATVAAVWGWARVGRATPENTVRFTLTMPNDVRVQAVSGSTYAISPDGRMIAFYANSSLGPAFYVRSSDQLTVRRLEGTGGGRHPAFSPDGRWLAFSAGSEIKKMSVDGGPTIPLAVVPAPLGISWGVQESLVVAADSGLMVIPSSGGTPRVFSSGKGERTARWPLVLDDGKTVLFTIWGGTLATARIGVTSIDDGERRSLDLPGSFPAAVIDGKLIYAGTNGALLAVSFDAKGKRVTGSPVPVADSVVSEPLGGAMVAVSKSGVLVYLNGRTVSLPVLVDARGVAKPINDELRAYSAPRYSPNGKQIAFTIATSQSTDIWIFDTQTQILQRRTTEGTNERPEWTADGKRIVYRSDRGKGGQLWWQAADGSGIAEQLLKFDDDPFEGVISPDGKTLLFRTGPTGRGVRDIFSVPLDGERTVRPFVVSPFSEQMPRFSPDGKWVAYQSNESGKTEVYVRPFPGPGAPYQISAAGGTEPVWSRDGRRLYYRDVTKVLAATVTTAPSLAVVHLEQVIDGNYAVNPSHANYDVAPDGAHFLMLKSADDEAQTVVVHNWLRELRARTSAKSGG